MALRYFAGKRGAGVNAEWFVYIDNADGTARLGVKSTGNTTWRGRTATGAIPGGWHHVAFVYTNPSTLTIYVDGLAVSATSDSSGIARMGNLVGPYIIGGYADTYPTSPSRFEGDMAGHAFTPLALSGAQILAHAQAADLAAYEAAVLADGATGLWLMQEGSGSLADESPSGFTASPVGSPDYSRPGPFSGSTSIGFSDNAHFEVPDNDTFSAAAFTVEGWVRVGFDQGPTAALTATPASGTEPLNVTFSGAASSDPDGTIVSYAWDFGDGDTGTGVAPSHVYTAPGSYTVALTVTDDDGYTDVATDTVTVDPDMTTAPATCDAQLVPEDQLFAAGITPLAGSYGDWTIDVLSLTRVTPGEITFRVRFTAEVELSDGAPGSDYASSLWFSASSRVDEFALGIACNTLGPPASTVIGSTGGGPTPIFGPNPSEPSMGDGWQWADGATIPAGATYTFDVVVDTFAAGCEVVALDIRFASRDPGFTDGMKYAYTLIDGCDPDPEPIDSCVINTWEFSDGSWYACGPPPVVFTSPVCIPGAQLGSGEDTRVLLVSRGAERILAELNPTAGFFERTLNDTSAAKVIGSSSGFLGEACCAEWADVAPWATEIIIFRDGRDAWSGPVVDAKFNYGVVEIDAADLTAWWDRRLVPDMRITDECLGFIFRQLHNAAMAPAPIPNFDVMECTHPIKTDRFYRATDYRYVMDEVTELGKSGFDWTAYSRTVITGDGELDLKPYIRFTDDFWSVPPTVRARGNEQATVVVVKGKGMAATATATQDYLDYYGYLVRVFDEPDLDNFDSLQRQAENQLALLKDPLYIETPNGATLKSTAPITLAELIPGIRVKVDARATCRPVSQDFRLVSVKANFNGNVGVELEPLGAIDPRNNA